MSEQAYEEPSEIEASEPVPEDQIPEQTEEEKEQQPETTKYEPPVFNVTIDYQTFSGFLKLIKFASDEPRIRIEEDGFHVRQMDPSKVYLIDALLPKTCFEEYAVAKTGNLTVNLEYLEYAVKGLKSEDKVRLEINEDDERVTVAAIGSLVYVTKLAFLEPFDETPDLPKINFTAMAIMMISHLRKKVFERASKVTDHVKIIIEDGQVTFEGEGDVAGFKATVKYGDEPLLKAETAGTEHKVKGSYSLDIVCEFLKTLGKDVEVAEFHIAEDMPIKIIPRFNTGELKAEFYLAPRIEVD